jgi:RNA polymerase sigma-70 factor (ECF subfamily)
MQPALVEGLWDAMSVRADEAQSGGEVSSAGEGGPTDEASLVREALCGDRQAWSALIQRHQHRVLLSLLARGVRVDRARELVQETWARLIQQQQRGALRELRLPGLAISQAAWLALDEVRRTRREDAAAGAQAPEGPGEPVDPATSAEVRLLGAEQLARAREALEDVSPGARRVFLLVYEHPELPHAEVAARVGLSVQRVRQILCEVRKHLRAVLEETHRG